MKTLAFYLPQYHPVEENDTWWGQGFTEWTNVARARPRFQGHYQPHIPADTGFYDLRCPETRDLQASLAMSYGIDGFCYYHYWFHGHRVLNRPIDEVLGSGSPNFPFCFCWANESWTRSWDGKSGEVLISQEYSAEDDLEHIEWLLNVFKDKRYIKINGFPLFLIYRTDTIKNISETILKWNNKAIEEGFPGIYFCAVRSNFNNLKDEDSISNGFSAVVDFQPSVKDYKKINNFKKVGRHFKIITNKIFLKLYPKLNLFTTIRISYDELINNSLSRIEKCNYKIFPCIIPNWDNSPRKHNSIVIQNDSPSNYGRWLEAACKFVIKRYKPEERIIFINAWNEWGEGAHLEPDLRNGRAFLEVTKKIISRYKPNS